MRRGTWRYTGGAHGCGRPPALTYEALLEEARACVSAALDTLGIAGGGYDVGLPVRPGFGDASCNAAFVLAARARRRPRELAAEIAAACRPRSLIARIEAHDSGHINFFADAPALARSVVESAIGGLSGASDAGRGRSVTVEHTSVNPNKALHIGHVRNVVIGDSLSRILARAGYRVRTLNYVDDLGLQVASLVLGFMRMGFSETPPEGVRFDRYCGDTVYVSVTEKTDSDPKAKAEVAEILAAMEDSKSAEARLAARVSGEILGAQLETCWRLGAEYDCLNFESHIIGSGLWDRIFAALREGGLIRLEKDGDNAGCWIVPDPDADAGKKGAGDGGDKKDRENKDKVLVRSNGTVTYAAKDIPYAAWKLGRLPDPFTYVGYAGARQLRPLVQSALGGGGEPREFSSDRVITVIDSRQTQVQEVISSLLERFFKIPAGSYVHLAYESVALSASTAAQLGKKTGGRRVQMSGRQGLYVSADDVLDALEERAGAETAARNPGMPAGEMRDISRQIAVGAIRYEMIRQDLDKMITFDLERSLRLDGDTAAYLQYSHARAARILEKAPKGGAEPDYALLSGAHERELVRAVGTLGFALSDAAANLSPKVVARYAHGLTVAFNAFYEHVRVIGGDGGEGATSARIALVRAFEASLESALGAIGIPLPPRM